MKDDFLDALEDLKDKLSEFDKLQIAAVMTVVLCLVLSLAFGLGMRGRRADYLAKSAENDAQIMSLKSELSALAGETSGAAEPGEVEVALKSANTAGMAVAGLQTAYQDCMVNAGTEPGSGTAEENITRNAEALDVYFDDASKGARVPWFIVTSENHARLVWTFMTNYTFTADSVECLWTCRDTQDNLVAFAMGTYDGTSGLFSDVKYYATAYGNKNYRTPDDPVPVYSIDLSDGTATTLVDPEGILYPEGYMFNENGELVDENGDPYLGNEEWASDFEELFKSSKEYREFLLSKQGAKK